MLQILNGFLSAATPTNIVMSFQDSGISLKRTDLKTFCKVTPETVRLYGGGRGKAAEMIQRFDQLAAEARQAAEAEVNPNDAEVTVNMEEYVETVLEMMEQQQQQEQ
jgi:hypothetical protein